MFGDSQPAPTACERLAEERPAFNLYGPATFLNQTAIAAGDLLKDQSSAAQQRAAAAARAAELRARKLGLSKGEQSAAASAAFEQVMAGFQQQLLRAADRYGLSGVPDINDPNYVNTVVFDPRIGGGTPKARFSFLFPSPDSAMITVRLDPGLDAAGRERAIGLFRDAVADPAFALDGGSYVVSGVPVIFDGLAQTLSSEILILLAVALAVMAITLALVFGPPLRLLPLALALGAAAVTFGLLALLGGSLTMASIAVLPVLTGLAVDYAIQFQARFAEAVAEGSSPPRAAVEAAAQGRAGDRDGAARDRRRIRGPVALADPDDSLLRPAVGGRDRDRLRLRADGGAGGVVADAAGHAAGVLRNYSDRILRFASGPVGFGRRPAGLLGPSLPRLRR